MCGIVGLLIKQPRLRHSLGELVTPMLVCMGERGADSAGLAVFSEPSARRRFSLYVPDAHFDWEAFAEHLTRDTKTQNQIASKENHAVLTSSIEPATLKTWLAEAYPVLHVLSAGHSIDVYKDTGHPRELERRY